MFPSTSTFHTPLWAATRAARSGTAKVVFIEPKIPIVMTDNFNSNERGGLEEPRLREYISAPPVEKDYAYI
jgi:hypothetical protein